jgi:hypothetical protein
MSCGSEQSHAPSVCNHGIQRQNQPLGARPDSRLSRRRTERPITDECRCAACGGLPFGTCLRSLAGPLRAPARSLRHVGAHFTLAAMPVGIGAYRA